MIQTGQSCQVRIRQQKSSNIIKHPYIFFLIIKITIQDSKTKSSRCDDISAASPSQTSAERRGKGVLTGHDSPS
jgi:hypothetical protein